MSHLLSAVDRILVLLLGVALVATGAWALLWLLDVDEAHSIARYYDSSVLENFLDSQWYPVALVAVAAAAALAGISLVSANLRRRKFDRLTASELPVGDSISVSVARVARSVGDSLAEKPDVDSASTSTTMDRGRRVVQWVVTAQPDIDLAGLVSDIQTADEDFHAALPGVELTTRFLVHLRPVDSP